VGTTDVHAAIFKRLAHGIERSRSELAKFVEEQHPAM
jgi:hypothetical protein